MSGVRILHFRKDGWKFIQIHRYYTMALRLLCNFFNTLVVLSKKKFFTSVLQRPILCIKFLCIASNTSKYGLRHLQYRDHIDIDMKLIQTIVLFFNTNA